MILKYQSAPMFLAARDVLSGLMSAGILPIASMTPRLHDLTIEIETREESAQIDNPPDDPMDDSVDGDGIPLNVRCARCGCMNGNHTTDNASCYGDLGFRDCECAGFVPVPQ